MKNYNFGKCYQGKVPGNCGSMQQRELIWLEKLGKAFLRKERLN